MAFVVVWIVHLSLIVWGTRAVLARLKHEPLRSWWVPALVYKVLAGWLLGFIYFFYYRQGDTLHYFADASQLADIAYQQPVVYLRTLLGLDVPPATLKFIGQPRALYFVKLVSLLNVVTLNNYWLSSAYLSIFSAASSWILANYLSKRFTHGRGPAVVAFLCYPSVVFWGSGLLKESVAVASLMLIVWIALRMDDENFDASRLVGTLLLLAGAAWLLWQVKYYYAGVLLSTLVSTMVVCRASTGQVSGSNIVWLIVGFVILGSSAGLLHPRLRVDNLVQSLIENHNTLVQMSEPENIIHFWSLADNYESLMLNLPWALFSGLFRPLIGDGQGALAWLAGIENTLLLLLSVRAMLRGSVWNRPGTRPGARPRTLWIIAVVVYTVALASLLAIASPNFGSLMRYKVSFLPFLVFIVIAGNHPLPQLRWFR